MGRGPLGICKGTIASLLSRTFLRRGDSTSKDPSCDEDKCPDGHGKLLADAVAPRVDAPRRQFSSPT